MLKGPMPICTREELEKLSKHTQRGKQMRVTDLIAALGRLYEQHGDIRVTVLDEDAWIEYPKIKVRSVGGDDLEDDESPYIAVAFGR